MAGNPSDDVLRQVRRLYNFGAVGAMSDAQLLDRFLSRRDEAAEAAFEELVIRHGPMVLRVCRSVLHDGHDAEDAFQAVFLVLAGRARSIRRSGSVACWLFGVAHRVATHARRSAARRRRLDQLIAERTSAIDSPSNNDPNWGVLHEEIDGLPERLRAPLVLCYLQGLTYTVAAHQLGVSEVAIRGRLARARDRLRKRLIRRGVTVPAGLLVAGAVGEAHAAIPLIVIRSTIRIALGFTAGNTAVVLARGVLNSMLFNQLRVAMVLLVLGIGGGFGAWHALVAADDGTGQTKPASKVPTVQLINPPVRNIVRAVGKPSFIEAYERTSIYPKLTAYIKEWKVDIGDKVKKGQTLATLFAPELLEDYETKKATVVLGRERIAVAKEGVTVAEGAMKAAEARLKQTRSALTKAQAAVKLWDAEVRRLQQEVDQAVVDPKIVIESRNRLEFSTAKRDAAQATIEQAEAKLLTRRAALAKAKLNVRLTEADLKVAESDQKRLAAWVGYLTLSAPFDGVIVARNANTFDLVQPAQGAAPIYVVDRTDLVRVFVEISEENARYVHIGSKSSVLAKAYRDELIPAAVTRTSWALNVKSRTLRVEIDLPNPGSQLLPGMYAYGKVFIEHPGVRALPMAAVTRSDGQTYCWTYENGHAVRTPIETGLSDGEWIEVINRRVPTARAAAVTDKPWTPINGSEQVILGDLPHLQDGGPVQVAPAPSGRK